MIKIINAVSPYVYLFLIVGSVFFGISIAVNFWLAKTINNVRKESDKNFKKYLTDSEQNKVNLAIKSAKIEYSNYNIQKEKNKKINRKNRFKRTLKLKEKPLLNEFDIKEIFLTFIKDVYSPFSYKNGEERGYLSFSKNEIFSILNLLTLRVDKILSKSGASWIKNVKVSFIVSGIEAYSQYKSFFDKLWVLFAYNFIKFFMWFFRIISPVAISKYFIKNLSSNNLSTIISDTLVEVVGKELAVIYKNNRIG